MKHFNLLKTLLLLCALIVGSLSGWADTVTLSSAQIKSGSGSSSYGACSATDGDGNTWSAYAIKNQHSKATSDYNFWQIKKYASSTAYYIQVPTLGSKITSISLVVSGSSQPRDNGGNSATLYFSNSNSTSTTGVGVVSGTGANSVTLDCSSLNLNSGYITASGAVRIWDIEVTYNPAGPVDARAVTTTTINVPDGFKTDLENGVDVAAGTLTATVTPAGSSALASPSIVWSSSDETVATIGASTGVVTLKKVGTTTITASYEGDESYKPSSNTYVLNVVNTYAKGQVNNPYSVSEALTAISSLANYGTIADQYVRGIVSTTGKVSSGAVTYYISDNGSTENQLEVYKGKNTNGTDFTNDTNLELGDEVVVYGTLKNYNTTPEFDSNSQVISRITKIAPTFLLDKSSETLDAYTHETVDVTLTTNTDGDVTCESSNPDVATVALKSAGVYTITAQSEGSATITIKSATSATYKPASAIVAITVEDERADAGISFAEADIEKTWGESFTGQALTNTNSVDVAYSSTDESVATVSSTGVVAVLKAGSTTIKATFAGNATYKAAVASYELTINKAEAGLSFGETEFDVDLNDDSFVAPTLNNPNSLTVTYTSSNDNVAVVDDNTGELFLETSAEGTVTITATFAGNDNFKSGNASYTITITDPNRKGTKKNPYTVAEVISGAATGSGIYVRGVIVGEFVGKTTDPRTSDFTTDANIALADAYTASPSCSSTIPVAMTNNSQRNLWGNQTNKGTTMGYEVIVKGNKDSYFSVNGIKGTSEVIGVSAPVTISGAGFATYASNVDLDFTGITGLKVYKATVSGTTITFDKITTVPAGEGVLLQGDEGIYEVPVISGVTPWAADYNAFVRGTGAAVATGGGPYNYILNKVNGVVGFYKANGQTVAKNRAYLQSTTAAARISLNFDEETTGISEVVKSDANNKVFDLQGRHIAQPTKGLYIMNGRKVLVK